MTEDMQICSRGLLPQWHNRDNINRVMMTIATRYTRLAQASFGKVNKRLRLCVIKLHNFAINFFFASAAQTHPIHFHQRSAASPWWTRERRTDKTNRAAFAAHSCQSAARRRTEEWDSGLVHTPLIPCWWMIIGPSLVFLSLLSFRRVLLLAYVRLGIRRWNEKSASRRYFTPRKRAAGVISSRCNKRLNEIRNLHFSLVGLREMSLELIFLSFRVRFQVD